jgi:hypothetical protein
MILAGAATLLLSLATGCLTDAVPTKKEEEKKPAGGGTAGGGTAGGGASGGGAAAGPDMREYMQAMSPMMGTKDGLKKGLWVTQKMDGAAKGETKYAVVDETADSWMIEMEGMATQGYIQAMVVNKKDGKVTEAYAAKKGEKLKKIKVMEMAAPVAGETPTTDEDVTVKAGSFKAKKAVSGDITSWSGVDGDAKGVMLKMTNAKDAKQDMELTALAPEDYKNGDQPVKTKHATYSNGTEYWIADMTIPFAGSGYAVMKTGGMTISYTWGEGAKAQLDWKNK